jgi:hypothetical protein
MNVYSATMLGLLSFSQLAIAQSGIDAVVRTVPVEFAQCQ